MTKQMIIIGVVCLGIAFILSLKASKPRKFRRYAYAVAFVVMMLVGIYLPMEAGSALPIEESNDDDEYSNYDEDVPREYAPAYWEYASNIELGQYSLVTPQIVDATSYLRVASMDYVPGLAVDGDLSTCWQEGVDGYGEGQDFFVKFETGFTPEYIVIYNGQSVDESRYYNNGRVSQLRITAGDYVEYVQLPDEITPIAIKLTGWEEVSEISFKIESVYPGSVYQDTCLTEIMFYD